jgi:hypothetical protein
LMGWIMAASRGGYPFKLPPRPRGRLIGVKS